MTKERYVSSLIAKLLKEKGFAEQCRAYYIDTKESVMECCANSINWNKGSSSYYMSAPTQQMACDWCQGKGVLITYNLLDYFDDKLRVKVYKKDYDLNWVTETSIICDSLEKGINEALEYAIKNII